MRTVVLASLRRHGRRYVAAVVAVVIGAGFIVLTGALTSAARDGLTAGVGAPYEAADAVVHDVDGATAAKLLALADREGAQASVQGWTPLPVSRDGNPLGDRVDVAPLPAHEDLRWQELREGRFPTSAGEVVVDAQDAKSVDVTVGDRLVLGRGEEALAVTVVGTVDSPSVAAAGSVYVLQQAHQRWADTTWVTSVAWADGSGDVGDVRRTIAAAFPDASVSAVDDFVADEQERLNEGVDVLTMMLMVFAGVALFVAVMVIANTFTIVFAQRRQELALTRCVGATSTQLLRAVRLEALALGGLSSVVGAGLGLAGGHGLVALVQQVAPEARLGAVEVAWPWYAAALATGVLATLCAAWLPTRRAVQVSPVAALRPDDGSKTGRALGLARRLAGIGALGLGVALLVVAVQGELLVAMLAGGALTFAGVLCFGPVLVPALIRAVGVLLRRTSGRLATRNALRNPRRSAATASALIVGVTLCTAVLTGMASARVAVDEEMDASHPLDAALTSSSGALPGNVLDAVRDTAGVTKAAVLPGTTARVGGEPVTVLAVGEDAGEGLVHGSPDFVPPAPGEIWLPGEMEAPVDGGTVVVRAGGEQVRLEVRRSGGWGPEGALVHPVTLQRLAAAPEPRAVWVRAASDTDVDDLGGDLAAVAASAGLVVENGLEQRAWVDLQLDVLTGAVLGLLGVAVVIALVGIASTLGLSVLERSREHALLRALGLERRQLRATLAAEAGLLTVAAAVIGAGLGVLFAWVGVLTMVRPAVEGASLVLPYGQLALVVLVSGAAGLVAAVLPARKAARVAPAAGLAVE